MKKYKIHLLLFLFFLLSFTSRSQVPLADFELPSSVCLDEYLPIKNTTGTSVDINYNWDFCSGDFLETPAVEDVNTLGLGITQLTGAAYIYENDKWYGYFLNRSVPSKIFRSISTSLKALSTTGAAELSSVSSSLVQSEAMDFVKGPDNIWYAYVGHLNISSGIVRMKFGEGLNQEPTLVENIGDPEGTRIRGLKLINSNGSYFLITTGYNTNRIAVYSLGSSPFGEILSSNIRITGSFTQLANPTGVEVIKDGNAWIAYVVSQSNGNLVRLNFGSSLENTPVFEKSYSLGLSQPRELRIVKDGAEYFLTVGSEGESISVIALGDLNVNFAVKKIVHENLPKSFGYAVVDSASTKYIITASTNKINYFTFNKDCGTLQNYSEKFEPLVSYAQPGIYPITLTATDESGNVSSTTEQLEVLDQTAPQTEIQQDGNLCLSNGKIFSAQNLTPDQTITSYIWDFGDETSATGSEATHQYTSPGNYKVRLSVESENGCGNFIEKDVSIYAAPEPDFTFPTTSICTNGEISFENTTPGEYKKEDITWLWDFGDGATSSEKDPNHTYTTGGTKTVTMTASIPGCSESKSYELTVIEGPSVNFVEDRLCFGQTVQFTNLSDGVGITEYAWDFGNGESSLAVNPTVAYDEPGDYEVSLTVKNAVGCSNTLKKSIKINALPVVNFDVASACSGAPVQFQDKSTIANGSVSSWLWKFGDGAEAATKNPSHIFEEAGTYDVRLIVTTVAGCKDSVTQSVNVNISPIADFEVEFGCPGTLTRFRDTSLDPGGDGIEVNYWIINGIYHYTQNPAVLFTKAGTYDVTLDITSGTSCRSSITKNIVIDPLPTANFTFENTCIGSPTMFSDQSEVVVADDIENWNWRFGEFGTSTEQNPTFEFPQTGSFPVTLTVTTKRGCSTIINKTVSINALPQANFSTQNNFGAPPLSVDFLNNSTGASTYQWWFGDAENSMSQESAPAFVYNEVGDYEVKMVATSAGGCSDTAYATISVLISELDVALENISVFTNTGDMQIVLTLRNNGTVPVSNMDINLDLGGTLSLNERFSEMIGPGETINYPVGFDILEKDLPGIAYICASLSVINDNLEEVNLADNVRCLDIQGLFLLTDPYPNPINHTFNLEFFMPEKVEVGMLVTDMRGKIVMDLDLPGTKAGQNKYSYDFSLLAAGMYVVKIAHKNETFVRKVMVQ